MPTLLQITTSIFADQGESSQLASHYARHWLERHPEGSVVTRDLGDGSLPHLTAERFQAFLTPEDERDETQQQHALASQQLIDELANADEVVIGLPMYNLGIPSGFKAWFDHIGRAGVTFRYTENGPQGLLADRPVTVLAARGGMYAGTEKDSQTLHVKHFFGLIGITSVQFVYAEGLNMGPEQKEKALNDAAEAIHRLAA